MHSFLDIFATWLHSFLPVWVRLPSLTFVLPHEIYWSGLVLFPLLAMFIVHKTNQNGKKHAVSIAIAYLLWVWGGFVGLHRFYVMAIKTGMIYVLLFLLLLYGNVQTTKSRNSLSGTNNEQRIAEFNVKKLKRNMARGRDSDKPKLEKAQEKLTAAKEQVRIANQKHDKWRAFSGGFLGMIIIYLLLDAILIPWLVIKRRRVEKNVRQKEFDVMERGTKRDERAEITSPTIRAIEWISGKSGEFVAYWSLLAVFVYYYEVIARYVFNSPTNWAHESMFLMFGMQYLLSGGYALREDAHVRVDVIYERFSTRTKAKIDLVTSFFFFVFTLTLLVTGYLFAKDSLDVLEISFTEWGIQYWPVKITIIIGAILLLLQGTAKLIRDITYVRREQGA